MTGMTRLLPALLLCASVASAYAGLDTEGLPPGAAAVVGFDLTTFRASKVGQATLRLADLKAKNLETSEKFRRQLGIDTEKDLREVAVAVYPGPDGKVQDKQGAVVLIRGRFDPARIDAFGQANGVPVRTVGKHQAWEGSAFVEKLTGEKPKESAAEAYVVAHSPGLLLVATTDFLETAVAAADRGGRPQLIPAEAAGRFDAAPNSWLYVYGDARKMKGFKEDSGAEELVVILGEQGADLRLDTAAQFVTPEKAATTRKQLMGLQALAGIGLANDDGKSPEEKADMALLADLVQKIRIGGEGRLVTLALDFPADKAVAAIVKAVEKSQQAPAKKK